MSYGDSSNVDGIQYQSTSCSKALEYLCLSLRQSHGTMTRRRGFDFQHRSAGAGVFGIDGSNGNDRVMLNLDITGLGSYLEECKDRMP